jgi:Fe-S-cluster containining protein
MEIKTTKSQRENLISMKMCKACAECCKNYPLIKVSKNEINSLELFTGLHFGIPINSKGVEYEGYLLQFKENGDCFFLNENNGHYSCDVYEVRPDICKNYPSNLRQKEVCTLNMKKLLNMTDSIVGD